MKTKNAAINVTINVNVLNLACQPFRSNALLSELSRTVLLGISLNCLWFLHHFRHGLS